MTDKKWGATIIAPRYMSFRFSFFVVKMACVRSLSSKQVNTGHCEIYYFMPLLMGSILEVLKVED